MYTLARIIHVAFCPEERSAILLFCVGFREDFTSRVQVDGVDLIEAAVDASCLEEEAVIRAGRHGVTPPCLALQHIKP